MAHCLRRRIEGSVPHAKESAMYAPLSLVLDSANLQPFEDALEQARGSLRDAQDRTAAAFEAERRLGLLAFARTPEFVRERLDLIPAIGAMLRDGRWDAPAAFAQDLAGALAYFSDQCDLIPDASPQFGLLDDALVVELALRRHLTEWREWRRFDALRQARADLAEDLDRAAWLALRDRQRQQLLQRTPWNRFARAASQRTDGSSFRVH
jgi:hypothetical protein